MFRIRFYESQCVALFYPPEAPIGLNNLFEERVLFVWDHLMDPEVVRGLLGRYVAAAPAYAMGLSRRAVREGEGREFQLAAEENAVTPGLVLIGLSEQDLEKLDDHQRAPIHLVRQKAKVRIGDLERVVDMYQSAGAYLGEE